MPSIKNTYYGSLRKGEYNYEAFKRVFGEENIKYLGTRTIKGYELHSLGAYPTVIPNPDAELVVDDFEVSEEVDNAVRDMELGAGYKEAKLEDSSIYYMTTLPSYARKRVEHGDWSRYLRENGRN